MKVTLSTNMNIKNKTKHSTHIHINMKKQD